MKHIYDKKMSEVFKKAFAKHQPPYEPDDWLALRSKLRAQNRERKWYNKYKHILFVLILLLFFSIGGGLMWLYLPDAEQPKSVQQAENSENLSKSKEEATKTTDLQTSKPSQLQALTPTKGAGSIGRQTQQTNAGSKQEVVMNDSEQQPQKSVFAKPLTATKNTADQANRKPSSKLLTQKSTPTGLNPQAEIAEIAIRPSLATGLEWKALAAIDAKPPQFLLDSIVVDTTADKSFLAKQPMRLRWIASGIAIGPSFTRSKHAGYSSQDANLMLGITSDFAISNKFSIATGLYYTKREMTIYPKGKEIVPSNQFVSNPSSVTINQERIAGSWQLLEVPVVLRYDFHQRNKSRLFVGAGINNLFYLHEYYREDFWLEYSQVPDPRVSRTQRVLYEREASHVIDLASMVYISAGIETRISKVLSLQVEPYWQLPVRSLGSEGVFVQTGGVNMRLQWSRR